MRKLIPAMLIACAAFLLPTTSLFAQIDTSTTQKLLQYIFQNIDKSQVPTSFLEEYGCPIVPMETFNGTLTDSNRIDMNLWRTLYFQLQTSYCGSSSNPLADIISVNTAIRQNSAATSPIPIPLLIGQFNTVKSNAFSSNLLSYNSGTRQIYDVAGRGQSPYQGNNLFAACPNKNITTTGSATFVCPSGLTWNNTGKTISAINIDFANGNGFQPVAFNTPVTVSYADTGTKRWTIKVTLSDNSLLQCYSEYTVLKASGMAARFATPNTVIPWWGFIGPVSGIHSGALVSITYSSRNRTNTLRKPLIVVEGYDVSTRAPGIQNNYSVDDFINSINEPSATYDFNYQLDDIAGYDLVFVDFLDGADDIRRNAAVVETVINLVNTNKVPNDNNGNVIEQNVVMGLSMGGLVARYALAEMTKNNVSPATRLLITHDSPHRGANVPLGLQYMIRMMGGFQLFGYNVYSIYPQYDDAINLLDAPATQQMLLYRSTTANNFVNNTFLDGDYRNMITFAPGGPQPAYRFIATALGSECAHPLFNPGKTFINLGAGVSASIWARVLFFRIPIVSYKLAAEVEAYALPATGSTAKIARLYTINNLKLFGFINIFKQLYDNTAYAPGSQLPIDGVPGSTSPLLDNNALKELTNLPSFSRLSLSVSFPIASIFGASFGIYAYNAGVSYSFTFVPVASALDVSPFNANVFSQNYVNGVNQYYPSSAETFIAQETNTDPSITNNQHIRFTPRNAEWLYREMENLNNTVNCSSECTNNYYISGPDVVCTNGTYTIQGLPRGATVTWSISNPYAAPITVNGNSVTVTKNTYGNVTLTATLTGACTASATKSIEVGAPEAPTIGGMVGDNATICQGTWFNVYTNDGPYSQYVWSVIGGQVLSGQGTHEAIVQVDPLLYWQTTGYFEVDLQVYNACGDPLWLAVKHSTVEGCQGGGENSRRIGDSTASANKPRNDSRIIVNPNPAGNIVGLWLNSKYGSTTGGFDGISEVKLFTAAGKLVSTRKFSGNPNKVQLEVSGLASGIYFAEITDGTNKETRKIIIQH